MKRALLVVLACLAVAPARAQNIPASPPAPGASNACSRPPAPVLPSLAAAGALSVERVLQLRTERDAYFSAADAGLSCLDKEIDLRTRAMFASGAPMSDDLRRLGQAHQALSKERAATHESFLRLCMSWEDAKLIRLPGGCGGAVEGSQTQF